MQWTDELRVQLTAPEFARGELDDASEQIAACRDVLRMQLCVAGEVFRVAHRVLLAANRSSMFERGHDLHGIKVGDRSLEVKLSDDGLAIEVRRETGLVDTLRVDDSRVFDQHGNLIPYAEGYFGSLVLEFAAP